MNMQAVILRITVVALLGLVAVAGLIQSRPQDTNTVVTAPAAATSTAQVSTKTEGVQMLPTVTLATVSVRPSAAEIAAAMKETDARSPIADARGFDPMPHLINVRDSASMPALRLDMPYYSFGKVLRRSTKE